MISPTQSDLLFNLVGKQRVHRLHDVLARLPGVALGSGHEGRLGDQRDGIALRVESDESVQIWHEIDRSMLAEEALAICGQLPGSLRIAHLQQRCILTAEIPTQSESQLLDSLAEIRQGVDDVRSASPCRDEQREPIGDDVVEKALAESNLSKDDVVRCEWGWELQVRMMGDVVGVRLTTGGRGLRLHRKLLDGAALDGAVGEFSRCAAALQALRLNAQLRFARLAIDGSALVVESRLHRRLAEGKFITHAARAVAVAHQHAGPSIEILAREGEVAKRFVELFGISQ